MTAQLRTPSNSTNLYCAISRNIAQLLISYYCALLRYLYLLDLYDNFHAQYVFMPCFNGSLGNMSSRFCTSFSVSSIRMLKEEEGRVRWLTHGEADKLLSELPDHQNAMARFALSSGLRQGNVKKMKWANVDLERRVAFVAASDSKTNKAIGVPLNNDAIVILREEFGKHDEYVFTYLGNPITQVNTESWRKALKRAGIDDFRWHDLRHTWASWHVQNGTPLHVLKELGGWSSMDMVMRYAHLSPDHLSEYADNLSSLKVINAYLVGKLC